MSRMIDELLIETTPAWLRAAAISGGKTVDLVREPRDRAGGEGDIYLGRVVRIVAGLGAAFVDIGLARPALLDLGKTKPAEGAALVVQIVEAARGDKGARVARRISLAGVCAVLLPGEKGVAVSRRLANAGARRKLADSAAAALGPGAGVIVRAGAADAGSAALAAEIAVLRAEWRDIAVRAEAAAPPACLRAADPVLRIIETFAAADPQRIILADAGAAHAAAAVTRRLYPALAARIEASREQGALFDRHDVADALASAESRRVPLPAGGSIAVEPTEALIAIDVDTGAVAGARAALRTNLEAATEAARQLRLRDIGGLVAIDFIRLADGAARQRVLEALRRATADDRVAVQVLGWTHGGLVELIRPRARRAETVD